MVFSKDINALAHQEAIFKRRFICACASIPAIVALYGLARNGLRGGFSLKKLAVADLKHLNHPSTYLIFGSLFLKSYFLTELDGILQKNLLKKICSNYDQNLKEIEKLDDLRSLNQAIVDSEDSREILLYLIKNKDLYFSLYQRPALRVLNFEEFQCLKQWSLFVQKLPRPDNGAVPSKTLYHLELVGLFSILEKKLQFPLILIINRARASHGTQDEVAF